MTLTKKNLVVKIWGGLGNQMFQYATAKALSLENGTALLIDTSMFGKNMPNETPRNYRLNVFPNIKIEIADSELVEKIVPKFKLEFLNKLYKVSKRYFNLYKRHKLENSLTYSNIKMNTDLLYLEGYWQSEEYFLAKAQNIYSDFDLNFLRKEPFLQSFIQNIDSQISVSVHVRRGDYVTNSQANAFHGTCGLDYYEKAVASIVEMVSEDVFFFVFSDDVEWCKNNLNIPYKHSYVVTKEDYHDLYLMSICKHNIIANSSFSWWGAWLNRNMDKKVIAPEKWFSHDVKIDIIPLKWKRI